MDSTLAPDLAARRRARAIALNRWVYRLSQHWFPWTIALLSLWVILPWLAPVFMRWGWEGPARAIYGLYSLQCHQLPQRSSSYEGVFVKRRAAGAIHPRHRRGAAASCQVS